MYEIYDHFPAEYDELVLHEDARGNLKKYLKHYIKPHSSVIEFGAGTGRVTLQYIDIAGSVRVCDRSEQMLKKARVNLRDHADKLIFSIIDNGALNTVRGIYDHVIEGWAFGHTIHDYPDSVGQTAEALVSGATSLLKPGGTMIFIETLGTNVTSPMAPDSCLAEFYLLMEERYGFGRDIISTDYAFRDIPEAKRIMGFFFGETMADAVSGKQVTEFTGIWTKQIPSG